MPEVAGLFFGEDVSTSQLIELARDCTAAYLTVAKDCVELGKVIPALEKAAKDFRLIFAYEGSRLPVQKALALKGFDEALDVYKRQGLGSFFRNIVRAMEVSGLPRMIFTASFKVIPLTSFSSSFMMRSPLFSPAT